MKINEINFISGENLSQTASIEENDKTIDYETSQNLSADREETKPCSRDFYSALAETECTPSSQNGKLLTAKLYTPMSAR